MKEGHDIELFFHVTDIDFGPAASDFADGKLLF